MDLSKMTDEELIAEYTKRRILHTKNAAALRALKLAIGERNNKIVEAYNNLKAKNAELVKAATAKGIEAANK